MSLKPQENGYVEETIYPDYCNIEGIVVTDEARDKAITLLCEHLGVRIVLTNATKHGNFELVLKKEPK